MAHDDPEGWEYYNRTVAAADGDPDIFILSNLNNVGSVEVNAFQVHSAAVLQKSIREGFGLTVTEALWKGRPVVAGRVGGIVDQIQDGETGHLVSTVEECAERTRLVLDTPGDSRELALGARNMSDATSSRPDSCATGSFNSTSWKETPPRCASWPSPCAARRPRLGFPPWRAGAS